MGIVRSAHIQALNAKPAQLIGTGLHGGRVHMTQAGFPVVGGQIVSDNVFICLRLPTIARVVSLLVYQVTIAISGTWDIGLYRTDGTVRNGIAYATGLSLATPTLVEAAFAGGRNIDKMGQRVWQDAGDAADPGGYYDLALTMRDIVSPSNLLLSCTALYAIGD